MTDIRPSPEMLDAAAANRRDGAPLERARAKDEIHPCLHCGNPYLKGYPHRHATDPNTGYDPMPRKPAERAALVLVMRSEYMAELPVRIHVQQVPSHAEPIGVGQYSAEAAGWSLGEVEVLDTGPLGSPSWSHPFHQYIGSYYSQFGETVRKDKDLHLFPWSRNLEGLRRWCAGKHRTWSEHRGQPVCWTLVRLLVEGGYSVSRAADLVTITPERADELLTVALDKWWVWTSDDMNGLRSVRVKPKAA